MIWMCKKWDKKMYELICSAFKFWFLLLMVVGYIEYNDIFINKCWRCLSKINIFQKYYHFDKKINKRKTVAFSWIKRTFRVNRREEKFKRISLVCDQNFMSFSNKARYRKTSSLFILSLFSACCSKKKSLFSTQKKMTMIWREIDHPVSCCF